MGFLTDLEVSDAPFITRPENQFQYPCSSDWNDFQTNQNTWFLQEACNDADKDGVIDYIEQMEVKKVKENDIELYPNQVEDLLFVQTIDTDRLSQVTLYNEQWQVLIMKNISSGRLNLLF